MTKFPATRWALVSVSFITAGCARVGFHAMHAASAPGPVMQAGEVRQTSAVAQRPAGPSDANIAAFMLAEDNTDVSYARLAPQRARSERVKSFAEHMMMDHVRINNVLDELLEQMDVAAEDNAMSLAFRDESANQRDLMRNLEGSAFDSTYVANEVRYHARLLASIDTLLLPNARNPQLKQFLANVRPAIAAHLEHAEQLRAQMIAAK